MDERVRGRSRRRRIVIGPLAGAVGLLLLFGVGVYSIVRTVGCSRNGALTLNVTAAPEISPAVTAAADRFNDDDNRVGDKCVIAQVTTADPAAVTTLLSGKGASAGATERPDAWIPDSSLWTALARSSPEGAAGVEPTKTSVAQSPLVVGVPQSLAARLARQGGPAEPYWVDLFKTVGGPAGASGASGESGESGESGGSGAAGKPVIPRGLVRLQVPDPARNAPGMATLVLGNTLLAKVPDRQTAFTSLVRAVRESIIPNATAAYSSFRRDARGRYPVVLATEQSVFGYNQGTPEEPAVAVYPREGTLSMDYPFTVTTDDSDKSAAARLFERELRGDRTRDAVEKLGFRASNGDAPASFGVRTGVSAQPPRALPLPAARDVQQIMQSWARLALGVRMLVLFDISGSMNEKVAPGTSRLQATARVAQSGLPLLSDDSELGIWLFSTRLNGDQDWREEIPVGPLGQRLGSATRRQLILSGLGRLRVKRNGDTGLYDSLLAAYVMMKGTYKAEMVNTVLMFTDGRNDDDRGPTLAQALADLKREYDPNRPVQVIIQGYGGDVDVSELDRLAAATGGIVQVANTPEESKRLLLEAMSRRVCTPNC